MIMNFNHDLYGAEENKIKILFIHATPQCTFWYSNLILALAK